MNVVTSSVRGIVAPGFEPCADAFAANLAMLEVGAACAIRVGGRLVVDLWGGLSDRRTGRSWERDTLVPVFSVSKGVAAVCVLDLVARGLIDPDAPLARYWPEFAAHGKGAVTVRQALAHRAGVPLLDGTVRFDELGDVRHMAGRLAAQPPLFEPGEEHLYHAVTVGWITSELVWRVTGLTLSRYLASRVAEPLDLALFYGLPEDRVARVARLTHVDSTTGKRLEAMLVPGSTAWQATTMNGALSFSSDWGDHSVNDHRVQAMELGGVNLVADARSLAKFYDSCLAPVDGVRLLSDAVIADAIGPVSTGRQFGQVDDGPVWGTGVMIPWDLQPMLGGSSFGHDGMGGSLAFACPDRRVGFAYVRNGHVAGGSKDPAVYAVVDALSAILDAGD